MISRVGTDPPCPLPWVRSWYLLKHLFISSPKRITDGIIQLVLIFTTLIKNKWPLLQESLSVSL